MNIKNFFKPANFINWFLIFVPIAMILEFIHASGTLIFVTSALAIIPLAGLMGHATESLADKLGEGLGGLLNATFGNAAELIIAIIAMKEGKFEVVKASITGSIIGNILLVLGASIIAGGLKFSSQKFNRTASSLGSTLMTLSGIALIVPAIFHFLNQGHPQKVEQELSLEIAVVLFITYILSLIFSLKTHKHLYDGGECLEEKTEDDSGMHWNRGISLAVLVVATALVAIMSEFLVGSIEATAKQFKLSDIFIGVILVAIIGNAAEHSTAILMAMKNKMDLSVNIAVGSSLQIALFVAPVLIFASYFFGKPMDLIFTPMEVISVIISVMVLNLVTSDGESNWMEGVQMLAVYIILGMTFYFLPF
ncbi:MAG: calcium/proton exchanger [Desulfobacterales bacterium]|nr:calcium/proton exchanger [Desulfobacterales bacterium]